MRRKEKMFFEKYLIGILAIAVIILAFFWFYKTFFHSEEDSLPPRVLPTSTTVETFRADSMEGTWCVAYSDRKCLFVSEASIDGSTISFTANIDPNSSVTPGTNVEYISIMRYGSTHDIEEMHPFFYHIDFKTGTVTKENSPANKLRLNLYMKSAAAISGDAWADFVEDETESLF